MVIAALQAEAGKLKETGPLPVWSLDLVLRAGQCLFLEVIGVSEFSASIAVFFAALSRMGGRARYEPDANGPRHLPDHLSGAGQGSAAGAAVGSVIFCRLALSGKFCGQREIGEVNVGRARAGRSGLVLARFLTCEFQCHLAADPRLQRDEHSSAWST